MRRSARGLGLAAMGFFLALVVSACGGRTNEGTPTQGTVAADAPKSPEEYYKGVSQKQASLKKATRGR